MWWNVINVIECGEMIGIWFHSRGNGLLILSR